MRHYPIALITGCSSGIGLLTAIQMAKAGYYVIATIRNMNNASKLNEYISKSSIEDQITIELLDVTDDYSLSSFAKKLEEKYGEIDVLINNAGVAIGGFVESVSLEQYKEQFATNVFGVIALTKLVLPLMRNRGCGKIINISSISGLIGFPGLSAYAASKYALEGFSECLRLEVKQFGIDVVLVEPGSYQTAIWTKAKQDIEKVDVAYKPFYQAILSQLKDEGAFGNPEDVAKFITIISKKRRTKLRYMIGKGVRTKVLLHSFFSWRVWEKIVITILKKNRKK